MASDLPAEVAAVMGDAAPEEVALVKMLLECGQAHLFAGWAATGTDTDKKHRFFDQVKALEANYPGGVRAYVKNAQTLLKSSAVGENPFEGMKPEVPEGRKIEYGSPEFVTAEEGGLQAFHKCAMVLVAGGLGERLGYTDIKVSLPVQVTTEMTYLELYVQQILAMQRYSNKVSGTDSVVPLAIMTSDDTHLRTLALLEKHNYFGAAPGQVTLMKQEKVAALTDNDAHIALEDPYTIETKPHGHGDVHTLLCSTGLAKRWRDEGRKYIVFFQDTNALCFTVTIAAIGVSEELSFDINSIAVPRKAKDAVGGITRLVRPDGTSLTVNVEYNQLEPMLKASGFKDGDVNGPDGYSPYPGNINQLVFRIAPYVDVLDRTGGLVPEFVNPKYADAAKNKFKKPTRLECMMQDHPKVVPASTRVGFTQFPDWTYSPVKNDATEALAKAKAGVPGRSACEGEIEFYTAACRQLTAVGVPLPPTRVFEALGFDLPDPPHVVFHPNFAVSFAAFRGKFPTPAEVHITQRSTLVVEGPDVTISSLDLDGALIIKAVAGAVVNVKGLKVANEGWPLTPLGQQGGGEVVVVPDSIKIRGFTCTKKEARVLEFNEPGTYEVSA